MKRTIWAAAFLTLAVAIPACNSSDPDPTDPTDPTDPETPTACAERTDSACEEASDDGPTCQLVTLQEVGEDESELACLNGESRTVCVDVEEDNCDEGSTDPAGWEDSDGGLWMTDDGCGAPGLTSTDLGDVEDMCETEVPCEPAAGGAGGASAGGAGGEGGAPPCPAD